jgi:hypothetical protein
MSDLDRVLDFLKPGRVRSAFSNDVDQFSGLGHQSGRAHFRLRQNNDLRLP